MIISTRLFNKLQVGAAASLAALFLPLFTPFAQAAGFITLNDFDGPPGSIVTVSGGGWAWNEPIKIYLNHVGIDQDMPRLVAEVTTAPDDGTFSVDIEIPIINVVQDHLTISARNLAGEEAFNSFFVVPLQATIQSSGSHTPFGTITVSGSGFEKNAVVDISLEDRGHQTVQVDGSGSFSAPFAIPNLPSAVHRLIATSRGAQAIEYFWVDQFWPNLIPSHWYIVPGGTLTLQGSGFAAGEAVSLVDAATGATLAAGNANSAGSFSLSFEVPIEFAGLSKTLRAAGGTSNAAGEVTIVFGKFWPSAFPSLWYVMPGSSLSFSGGGFAPHENVKVFAGESTAPVAIFSADSAGGFAGNGEVTIPLNAGGTSMSWKLLGEKSAAETSVSVGVGNFYPSLAPSSYYARPGESVTIQAAGFAPGETVELSFAGGAVTTAAASPLGDAAFAATLPFSPVDSMLFLARGQSSGASASVSIGIGKFFPQITLSSYYGMGGMPLTVEGSGFAPSEEVTMTYGGVNFGKVTADATGGFSFMRVTPFVPPGAKGIIATGSLSGASTMAAYVQAEGYLLSPDILALIQSLF